MGGEVGRPRAQEPRPAASSDHKGRCAVLNRGVGTRLWRSVVRPWLDPVGVAQTAQRFLLTAPAVTAAALCEFPVLLGGLLVRGPQPLPEPAWPLPELADLVFGAEDWWDATIDALAHRSPEEHVQLAVQLFPLCRDFHARAVALFPEGSLDAEAIGAAATTVAGWHARLCRVLDVIGGSPDAAARRMIDLLQSSSTLVATTASACIARMWKAVACGKDVGQWHDLLVKSGEPREAESAIPLWDATLFFSIDPTRRELANGVMQRLIAPATTIAWDAAAGELVLHYPAHLPERAASYERDGWTPAWPPLPTEPPLATFLEALGWRARWVPGTENNQLRLDMGDAAFTRIAGRHTSDKLAALFAFWRNATTPRNDSVWPHAGLRLEINGLTCTHGPLPDAPERIGTVIDLGDTAIEAATDVLWHALAVASDPLQKQTPTAIRAASPVRVRMSDVAGLRRRLLDWSDTDVERTRSLRRTAMALVTRTSDALAAGQPLYPATRHELERCRVQCAEARERSIRCTSVWDLASTLGVVAAAGASGSARTDPLGEVLHDLRRRGQVWNNYDDAMDDLLEGRAISPRQRAFLATFATVSGGLHSVVAEALTLSRAEFDAAGLHLDMAEGVQSAIGQLIPAFPHPRRLTDLLANLLTNAARYGAGKIELLADPLPDGGVSFAVRDQGIGILPENIDQLGQPHFREARREHADSHGLGISSVVTTLREFGWGPLWVRSRPDAGSEFRFDIPGSALQRFERAEPAAAAPRPASTRHDPWGLGPPTRMEQLLDAGFVVPAAAMDLAVPQLLRAIPTGIPEHYSRDWPRDAGDHRIEPARLLLDGRLRYLRLEILHRLLSGVAGPAGITAVENAAGSEAGVAITLARLGTTVVIKEPAGLGLHNHQDTMRYHALEALRARVAYVTEWEQIHAADPQHRVVYWSHPNWQDLVLPSGYGLMAYFGRDVAPGGYVVVETDHHEGGAVQFGLSGIGNDGFKNLPFPPDQWERVFAADLPNLSEGLTNAVLPNGQEVNIHFQIWRRKAEA